MKSEPKRNADGNYNILFITTDQEHYFEEYPEGTEYQARKLLEELGQHLKNTMPARICPHLPDLLCIRGHISQILRW